jgi:integrase
MHTGRQESSLIPAPARRYDALGEALKLVSDAVTNPETRRSYSTALKEFAGRGFPCTRGGVQAWRRDMENRNLSASTINARLAAIRKLAREAGAIGLLDEQAVSSICSVQGVRQRGQKMGNWLDRDQAQALLDSPSAQTLKGKRDRCALALLIGCALRRSELASLCVEHIQQRDGRWVILDLIGKGRKIRTVPVPAWVKASLDVWTEAAAITSGCVLRGMNRHGAIVSQSLSDSNIWRIVEHYGAKIGVVIQPHDLRRTCAKLCRKHGDLEQIQLLLGHSSVQTTERYLGTKQDLHNAPNDRMGLK